MNTEKYNGWTNYATWRVNLEIFDGIDLTDWGRIPNRSDLAAVLKEMAEEAIDPEGNGGLAVDYALAFLSDVNWYEIADHVAPEEDEDAEGDE